MMRQLLTKEFKLTASPLTFIFICFSVMTMIPGYPILVGAFFICLGLLYTFQFAREDNDILYTALLPVKKSDVVKARFVFVIVIQMIGFALCLIMTRLRMSFLSEAKPYVTNPLMNANFVFLGGFLFIMTLYNVIFVAGFFRTAYYYGKSFVWFCVAAFLLIGLMETLHHVPGLKWLNTCGWDHMGIQLLILSAGIVLYVIGTIAALRKSMRTFAEIDL